ncbi:hypothetical protein RND81_05G180300 [Saponaria officinalis]|uniref:Uncharacterized protein n=1 Tax=Saponaria officinalis TaxID=3572 RepID=A0AAW1L0K4_SAPOF
MEAAFRFPVRASYFSVCICPTSKVPSMTMSFIATSNGEDEDDDDDDRITIGHSNNQISELPKLFRALTELPTTGSNAHSRCRPQFRMTVHLCLFAAARLTWIPISKTGIMSHGMHPLLQELKSN